MSLDLSAVVSAIVAFITAIVWLIRLEGKHLRVEDKIEISNGTVDDHDKRIQLLERNSAVYYNTMQTLQEDVRDIKTYVTEIGPKALAKSIIAGLKGHHL